jgi:hypothetical protein
MFFSLMHSIDEGFFFFLVVVVCLFGATFKSYVVMVTPVFLYKNF